MAISRVFCTFILAAAMAFAQPELLISRRAYRLQGPSFRQIVAVSNSGAMREITSSARNHNKFICSEDGRFIAFTSVISDLPYRTELWLLDRVARSEKLISEPSANSDVNPIGFHPETRAVYFWQTEGGRSELYRYTPASGKTEKVKQGCHAEWDTCSPDPAFAVTHKGGAPAMKTGWGLYATWSPSARRMAWISADNKRVEIYDAASKKLAGRIDLPTDPRHFPTPPRSVQWSPDEKHLLVTSYSGNSTAPAQAYWLLNLGTKQWKFLDDGNDARWAPDSTKIAFTSPRDLKPLGKQKVWTTELKVIDLAAGTTRTWNQTGTHYFEGPVWCNPPAGKPASAKTAPAGPKTTKPRATGASKGSRRRASPSPRT